MLIPPGLDFIEAALIMDNWGTPYGGIRRGNIKPGMDVLVNGCGPIGQGAIALCAEMGARVIAIDPLEFRRQYALKNGAVLALAPYELPNAALELTGGAGVDAVMECSGVGATYDNCLKSLKIGGTLVAIGEGAEININSSDQIIRRSLGIAGSWYSTMPQASEILQLALEKRIDLKCFLTHVITLEEVPEMFGPIINCERGIMKCVIAFE